MRIEIIPLIGITIEDVTIKLGMEKNQVIERLGNGFQGNRHYYYDNELAIDYDANGCVEFIEFLGGNEGGLKPYIYGISAFESDANDLLDVLKEKNSGEINDYENGYSYGFDNISVGIYRTATLESVQQDIEDMKADGEYSQEYVDEEMFKANHWATIGIGIIGYYSN